MENKLEKITQAMQSEFDALVEEFRSEAHVTVSPAQIVNVLTWLRDKQGFELLSALTAVDYWPQASSPQGEMPRFNVVYQLTSIANNLSIQVRVPLAEADPVVPTVSGVFASANWRERELWDMFGIRVDGHPDMRRILMPDDYDGHPLRKDFPLGYEEPQFSFNYDEISLRKPSPKE